MSEVRKRTFDKCVQYNAKAQNKEHINNVSREYLLKHNG